MITVLFLAFFAYFLRVKLNLYDSMHLAQNAMYLSFLDACDTDEACNSAVALHYLDCRDKHYVDSSDIAELQVQFVDFINNTEECIESLSGIEIPDVLQAMVDDRMEAEFSRQE